MPSDSYVPGICNIGPSEIDNRRKVGWVGVGFTVMLLVILVATHAAPIWRVLLFLPLFIATIGLFQAQLHFCVGFGFGGLYNVLKPAGTTETVEKAEFRAADRAKALLILGYSVVTSLIVTTLLATLL